MPIKHKPLPCASRLREFFRYFRSSGRLTWKNTKGGRSVLGAKIGYPDINGYLTMRFDGVLYCVHRVIWKHVTGEDPGEFEIDHINGVKEDNRWVNLRLATHARNNQNTKIQKNNSSGYKGVAWHGQRKAWRAYVSVGPRGNSKQIHLGLHSTPEAAAKAVRKYREQLHGKFTNHG